MQIFQTVLIISSIILGTFLLFKQLAPGSESCEYNIGCYKVPHALNHTQQIHDRLQSAKVALQPIAYQHRSIVADEPAFDKKVLAVANSFQKYVQQLAQQQQIRHKDRDILLAIRQAQKNYLQCKNQIDSSINTTFCINTWHQYEDCFQKVKKIQKNLDSLFLKEEQMQNAIKSEIDQPQSDSQNKPELVAQRIYNESIKKNEDSLNEYRDRLYHAQNKVRNSQEMKGKAQDRKQSKEHSYRQCWQNRRIYQHCQEISNQVKNLNVGTLRQLEQQLESKKKLMEEMRQMMVRMGKGQNRKMPEHWNQMYIAHVEEYKQMHRDFISQYSTQKQRKACGCTLQEQKQLQKDVQKQSQQILDLSAEIVQMTRVIDKLRKNIQEGQLQREKIITDYQQALKEYATTIPEKRQSQLIKLKKKLQSNRFDILNSQDDFNSLQEHCNSIKRKLSASIKDVDRVEECLGKKDYLIKLRQETAKYLQPQRSLAKLMESKRALYDALKGVGDM